MKVKIDRLKKDGLQLREALSEDVVAEYAEAMRNGAEFPPVTVFTEGGEFYLADGFHRVEAAMRNGRKWMEAELRPGGYYAAEAYACGANSVLPRSADTKRRCVMRLWEHRVEHFGKADPSERDIANLAKLPRSTVSSILGGLAKVGQLTLPKTVTGRDGVTRPRTPPPVRPTPNVPRMEPQTPQESEARFGYHIAEDGKEHADGIILDRFGTEIPPELTAAFQSDAIADWARRVSVVKSELERERLAGNALAAGLQRAEIQLANAYHEIKAAAPFCVCRMCQGSGCRACAEKGYQTKEQHERNPPEFRGN